MNYTKIRSLLHELVDCLCEGSPQSRLEPRVGAETSEPLPAPALSQETVLETIAVRKRGRPRGSKNKPRAQTETQEEVKDGKEPESPGAECRYCSRFIPRQALEIHEKNCRVAAIGYATEIHET